MPDLLEPAQPPAKPPGIPFNPSTASLAGQRSGQVRRQRAAILARKPINVTPLQPPDRAERTTSAQLALVSDQIKRTRDVLNDDDYRYCEHCERGGVEPQHRAQLLKALDVLLDRQRVLLGIPLPGSRRPSADPKGKRADWWIEMQPSAPALPAPVVYMQPTEPVAPQVPERLPGDVTP